MKKTISILLLIGLVLSANAQPANDNPCGAINIPVENIGCEPTTTYSWTGATFNAAYGNTYCNGFTNLDVWYKFTVPQNGEVNARIATATAYNMCAEFYTSTSCNAGSLTIFNQNTNGFPCMYASSSSGGDGNFKNLTPGSTVYIRVFSLGNNTTPNADLKICIANSSTLADEPCNAGFFPVDAADPLGQSCTPFKIFSWTGATLTPAIPNPCYASNPSFVRDVWFKVRVPASGKLDIRFQNNPPYSGQAIAVYNATSCNGIFTEIYCSFLGTTFTGLTPNSIIYCRLYSYSNSVVDYGSVKICVADFNSVPGINNNGKVGIGIDTPFAKLDVVGNAIFRDKVTTGNDLEVRGNLVVQGNILSKYNSNGGLKIGGYLSADSFALTSILGNRVSVFGGLGNVGQYGFGIQNSLFQMYSGSTSTDIAFGSGNSNNFSEVMRIKGNGLVGIGINVPSGKLDVNNGSVWFRGSTNISHFNLTGSEDTYIRGGKVGSRVLINDISSPGIVYIGSNVGIGNSNPSRPLSFPATLGEKILLYPGPNGEVGIGVYGNELRLHSDNPGAKVSFGTQDNAGNFSENALAQRNGVYAFSVLGSLWVNGTTYASDERFKQNISPIQSPLQKLIQLNGVEYEMKTGEFSKYYFQAGRQIGLLAQNVETVVPEAVSEMDGYKGVDYAKLVPLLIESIKAQQKQIAKQKQQMDEQKTKLDALQKLVEQLVQK